MWMWIGCAKGSKRIDQLSDCEFLKQVPTSLYCDRNKEGEPTLYRSVRRFSKSNYYLRHVCLPVRPSPWNNSAPTWRILMKYNMRIFHKSVEKIQVSFISTRMTGTFTLRPTKIYDVSPNFSYNKECLRQKVADKIKTRISSSITFSENRAVCETTWKKHVTARQATDDNRIQRVRFACWIPKATETHSEFVMLCAFFMATMVIRTRLNTTFIRTFPLSLII